MEIKGKVISLLPLQEGDGQNGPWKKLNFIIETDGQYPKKVCISLWGNKIDEYNLQEGEEVNVSINVESREYNERWYTDVKAWKIERVGSQHPVDNAPPTGDAPPFTSSDIPDVGNSSEEQDDLPF